MSSVDPWNDAWAEAEATAPPGVIIYPTLELIHPAFIDPVTLQQITIKCVTGTYTDQTFTLEQGAPVGGGLPVLFKAIPFAAERPTYEEGRTPETLITVDNVAREIIPYLEQAVIMRADVVTIYREYLSDDATQPAYGPVQFVMKQVKVSGTQVQGTAQIDDLANRKFPRLVYTINDFPSLIGN